MTIPVYDIATMPAIIYPMNNTHDETDLYLGNRAVTGKARADLTIKAKNDTAAAALYALWKDECNYGVEPFLVPLPFFGREMDTAVPSLLVRFDGPFAISKDSQIWNGGIKIVVIGTVDYIVDNLGDFIVSDLGEYTVNDAGDYVPTGNIIESYREINYGS